MLKRNTEIIIGVNFMTVKQGNDMGRVQGWLRWLAWPGWSPKIRWKMACCTLVLRLLNNELTQQTQRSKVFSIQHVLHVNSRSRLSAGWPVKGQGTLSCRGVPTDSTILQQALICAVSDEDLCGQTSLTHIIFYLSEKKSLFLALNALLSLKSLSFI